MIAEAWARALARDLADPPLALDVRALADLWPVEQVRIEAPRPPDFADYPELSVRIRGAFGRALADIGGVGAGRFSLPPPYVILFSSAGRWAPGLDIPKPMVIRAHAEHDRIVVELALFGVAGVYVEAATEALVECLARGIAFDPTSRTRLSLHADSVATTRIDSVSWLMRTRAASLTFRTPVCVRHGRGLSSDPRGIARSVVKRVAGMARWQGVRLTGDFDAPLREIEAAKYDAGGLLLARWQRFSLRQGPAPIPMDGFLGTLRLAGRLDALAPYLAIAATCNTGSHAALGLGWFDLSTA